jgi:hypothetical protein
MNGGSLALLEKSSGNAKRRKAVTCKRETGVGVGTQRRSSQTTVDVVQCDVENLDGGRWRRKSAAATIGTTFSQLFAMRRRSFCTCSTCHTEIATWSRVGEDKQSHHRQQSCQKLRRR